MTNNETEKSVELVRSTNGVLQLNDQHRSFLNRRGITDSVIEAFSLYSSDVAELGLKNAIIIPVSHPDGTLSFNKYRRDPMDESKPKYLYDRGGKVTLYGADQLLSNQPMEAQPLMRQPVVITEGELDTLVCWSQNIPAVTSTGGSLSFQEDWAKSLSNYDVFVCFDNDEAGYKGMLKVLDYLPEARVVIIPHNLGCKDISDYVARGGDMHSLLKGAYSVTDCEEARTLAERLGGQWRVQEAKFFEMYIDKNRPVLPSDVAGKANLDPRNVGRLEAAKSVLCESLLPFKRVGRYMKTQCLWHADNDPSLTLYPDKNDCYCHSCGKYADAVDIVQARDKLPAGKEGFKEAIKILLNEQ